MEEKVRLIVLSTISDFEYQYDHVRAQFIKWLLMEYPDTNTEVNPEKEFERFIESSNGYQTVRETIKNATDSYEYIFQKTGKSDVMLSDFCKWLAEKYENQQQVIDSNHEYHLFQDEEVQV